MRERQEFIDRYFVFSDGAYTPAVDYSRTRGLVSEILNTMQAVDAEQVLLEEMQARPPPEHVPRPPIGAAPFDSSQSEGPVIIEPEGEEGPEEGAEPEPPAEPEVEPEAQE